MSRLIYIFELVKKHGIIGFAKRLFKYVARYLQDVFSRIFHPVSLWFWNYIESNYHLGKHPSNALSVYYDLEVSPVTFDFLIFLIIAEAYRIEQKCEFLRVIIVPGRESGFRPGEIQSYRSYGANGYSEQNLHWRLWNVVIPACNLLSSCKSVFLCANREEAAQWRNSFSGISFPLNYTINFPVACYTYDHIYKIFLNQKKLPSLRATEGGKNHINNWITRNAGNRKVITITLRESPYVTTRNSSLSDWIKFAASLDKEVFFPVFLRDLESAFLPSSLQEAHCFVFPEPVWNLELRAALYEESYLNLGINNGPMGLCHLNVKTRYILFKMETANSPSSRTADLEKIGLFRGRQFANSTKFQRIVWADDTEDTIRKAFFEMCNIIDQEQCTYPRNPESSFPVQF